MNEVIEKLQDAEWFKKIAKRLISCKSISVGGLWGGCFELLLFLIIKNLSSTTLYITKNEEAAENSINNLKLFLPSEILYFPVLQQSFDVDIFTNRISVLYSLAQKAEKETQGLVLVSPIQSLLQPVPKIEKLKSCYVFLKVGGEQKIEDLVRQLQNAEFERQVQVELPGEFSQRGGIVDIWPYTQDKPFRIEFFGDTIDTIRVFDVETQLSKKNLKGISISLVKKSDFVRPSPEDMTMIFDYLEANTIVVLKEPKAVAGVSDKFLSLAQDKNIFNMKEIIEKLKEFMVFNFSSVPFTGEDAINLNVLSTQRIKGSIWDIIAEIKKLTKQNKKIFIFSKHSSETKRLEEILKDNDIDTRNIITRQGSLSEGFEISEPPTVFLSHSEMFHPYELRRPQKKRVPMFLDDFFEPEPGDFVVHTSYGIGKFLGMEKIEKNGQLQEFLVLEYQDRIKIYVPALSIDLVQKYIGGKGIIPRLSRIGDSLWQKKIDTVQNATLRFAKELLEVETLRLEKNGISFPEDSVWQREFEASFPYEETSDQVEISASLKKDMIRNTPMDRLLCGDVGYGKTELAMRAAFKAATSGFQTAVLVPTTILAEQHYRTFSDRMAEFPINIKVLSRFKAKKEQGEIVRDVKTGKIDILIGTHRILSPDVKFKNLGLVIIDEEQRFGVEHKEHLKRLRAVVDVLTMTATPIPRTLHMALLGIRNISNLTTPPQDRLSIKTDIIAFDRRRIRDAILRECERQGQCYFVHNRVYNIESIARRLCRLVPEARFEVAHGQMQESLLNERVLKFIAKEIDVLICTTIIESGLDIPNVNTIFVNDAHMFGLSDLHQLRGRVGRYKRKAYAYLIVPEDKLLTASSEKRVRAIEEFSELGSGFKIAMRDLEIRGAGNILGKEQSGYIQAVGYNMYCRLLKVSCQKLKSSHRASRTFKVQDKGFSIAQNNDIITDLNVAAFIPEDYISDTTLKLKMYRKIATSLDLESLKKVQDELLDRFGRFPQELKTLLELQGLKIIAMMLGITAIRRAEKAIIINFLDVKKIEQIFKKIRHRTKITDQNILQLKLSPREYAPLSSFRFIRKLLDRA